MIQYTKSIKIAIFGCLSPEIRTNTIIFISFSADYCPIAKNNPAAIQMKCGRIIICLFLF